MSPKLIDYEDLGDGTFLSELNERIEQAVSDIKGRPMVDKKRKIKLELTMDPSGKTMDVSQVVKLETPPESVDTTIYMEEESTGQGNLLNMQSQ